MGKTGLAMQRTARRTARTNPNAPVYSDAIHKAYAQGILHGIERQRVHNRARLFVHGVILASVTFGSVYAASRVLDYVQSTDTPIVECRQ